MGVQNSYQSGQKTNALVALIDIFPTLCALASLTVPETAQGEDFVSVLKDPSQGFRDVVYSHFKGAHAVVTERFAYTRFQGDQEMLYDHQNDLPENRNVAGDPEYSKTVAEMKQLLNAQIQKAKELPFD